MNVTVVEVSPKNCLRCIYGELSKNTKAKCKKTKPDPRVPFEDGKWMCHDFCVRIKGDEKV